MVSNDAELISAFATANATLLAAAITAGVGAVIFAVGEFLKLLRERRDRRTSAVLRLWDAWADVAAISSPRMDKRWRVYRRYPERVDISTLTVQLLAVLPRRDDEVITLQVEYNDELVRSKSESERVSASAAATAALTLWLSSRRRGRRFARAELTNRGVAVNLSGRPVRIATLPESFF